MRKLKNVLSILLIASVIFTMVSCGSKQKEYTLGPNGTITFEDGDVIGTGKTEFNLEVVDKDGGLKKATIKTDESTVGNALYALKVIDGENSSYGLYIKVVNGIVADYNVDQTYWAFYIDGEYALTGADSTDISAGSTYSFKVEK